MPSFSKGVRGSERLPGEFKRSQNWIGPPGCTLNEASYVPPPPHETLAAMGDLEHYFHDRERLPVLIDCALIHYQFETIHPFLDGNGRMGRLLVTFYLCWKGILHKPLLYLSYYFKRNRQEYYDRLNMVRETGNYEQWVDYFLKGVVDIAGAAMETARQILELQSGHRRLLWEKKISSPLAVGILEQLFYTPAVSIGQIAGRFNISYQAASTLVAQLEKVEILRETTGRKRDKALRIQRLPGHSCRRDKDLTLRGESPIPCSAFCKSSLASRRRSAVRSSRVTGRATSRSGMWCKPILADCTAQESRWPPRRAYSLESAQEGQEVELLAVDPAPQVVRYGSIPALRSKKHAFQHSMSKKFVIGHK